jgi:hypothetical protein
MDVLFIWWSKLLQGDQILQVIQARTISSGCSRYTSVELILRQIQSKQIGCVSQVTWNVSGELVVA